MVTLRSVAASFAGIALFCQSSIAHSIKRDALNYVTVIDDAVIKTPSHRVHSFSSFDLTFALHDGKQKVRLALEPNDELLHESFTVSHLDENGNIEKSEQIPRTEHKVFRGQTFVQRPGRKEWENTGFARITMLRDGKSPLFDGTFRIDGNGHHVHLGSRYRSLGHKNDPAIPSSGSPDDEIMVLWRDSDIRGSIWEQSELKRDVLVTENSTTCGVGSLGSFDANYDLKVRDGNFEQGMSTRSLFGRQNFDDGGRGSGGSANVNVLQTIGSTDGCPGTRRIALVGIAVDCTYWEQNETEEDLRKHVIGMVNDASQVYESTFNIAIGIANITINKRDCPSEASESAPWNVACGKADMNERLSLFSGWRGQFNDINAYWTLLTKCPTNTAVGLAWRGELCRQGSHQNPSDVTSDGSGSQGKMVSSTNVVVRTDTEWQIFAHETGHTFGAIHDCSDAARDCPVDQNKPECCPLSTDSCNAGGRYMMAPATSGGITGFSRCSIGNICSGLKDPNRASCLTNNKNIKTVMGSQCGNGIVESGEDCDCGGEQSCGNNPCCNPKTCKYADNAVCDPTNEECCTNQCRFAGSNTVCRTSVDDCDPEEKCPGNSGRCPEDKHKDDGSSCGTEDGLKCASGQCTSRGMQCRNMAGSLETNAGDCPRERDCMIKCSGDDLPSGVCRTYNQNFLDGTPCKAGGHCNGGKCEGTSAWKAFIEWCEDNKNIVIPVGAVLAVLLLIAFCSCIMSCFRRGRRRRTPPKPAAASNWPSNYGQPNHMFQQNNHPYMGNGNNMPPTYSYAPVPNGHEQQWQQNRSTRYA
jgi:hypothetical protein